MRVFMLWGVYLLLTVGIGNEIYNRNFSKEAREEQRLEDVQEEIEKKKAKVERSLVKKKEVKVPRAYRMTHEPNIPESEEIVVKRGVWLSEPVFVGKQKYLWVEFLNKQIPDDRAWVRCVNANREDKISRAEPRLVPLNTLRQVFSNVTPCRNFDVKLPQDSKMKSATVVFLTTQMH